MSPRRSGPSTDPTASALADSLGSGDDPKVASVLASYLAELEAGRRPSREDLLEQYSDVAEALADCLDVVEFVHSAAGSASSNSALPRPRDALPPDTTLGEYRLVRELGRGGMGIVYEAEQVSLGRRVALKVLSGTAALDPLKLQRFRVETQAVAQLHHPHIVPIFAIGGDRGTHFYAMQFIDGTTLAEVIHQQRRICQVPASKLESGPILSDVGPIPSGRPSAPGGPSTKSAGKGAFDLSPSSPAVSGTTSFRGRGAFRALAKLAIQAAEAIDHAHVMGILHRDIKPSNLMVDARGNLWVTDFGLARFQNEPGLTRTGDLLGTLRYIAPELVLGQRMVHDPRSDIYSLGATLYELLTLRPVFDGRDRQEVLRQISHAEPIAPRRLDPTIPRDLETIVLRAMDKEPDRRYPTAQELAEDLGRFLEDKTIRARRPTPAERTAKWARRHRAVLGAAAAAAFLALAIAAPVLWWEQHKTARMYQDLRLAVGQADVGFEHMIRLSDELTIKGMARYAEPGPSSGAEAIRAAFFRQAVEFYDRLVREHQVAKPILALAYRRLGFARMLGTQDPRAEGDLRRSLTLYEELLAGAPRDPELRDAIGDVQMNLGIVLMSTRGMVAAEPSFRRATSMDEGLVSDFPDDLPHLEQLTDRRLQIAAWLESSGLSTRAEQEWRQLLSFYQRLAAGSPGRARTTMAAHHRLARALGDLGRTREQQEVLRRGLELTPEDPALLNELAWSLAIRPDAPPRESGEAIELAKRSLAANPNDRASWNTLGLAHLRAEEWPLAAEALGMSMKLQAQGGDAADRLAMAMVSWRRGDKAAALDWYIRALDWMSRHPEPDASLLALRAETEHLLGRTPAADLGAKK
jgi:eukaryotic-like serine/threonine-protein kinase